MQSVEEHQETPEEVAAVMPVGGLRKRRRDRNLAAGRLQKPKKRIQATCESRRKLTVAGKKITRHVTVAWRKRDVLRRIGTQINYGPRKILTVTGKKTTSCETVAWHNENVVRKDCAGDRGLREQLRGRMGISDQCGGQPPYLRKEKTTTNGIGWWSEEHRSHQGSERATNKKLYENFRGRIARQIVGNPSGLRRIRKWTLWRGRPPPKQKRDSAQSKSRANVGAPATPGVTAHAVVCVCVRERELKKKILDDWNNLH
jgi:hypothetical protein